MNPYLGEVNQNEYVAALKSPAWAKLLDMLGSRGESIMTSMLLNCSLFKPVHDAAGGLYQISGQSDRSKLKNLADVSRSTII